MLTNYFSYFALYRDIQMHPNRVISYEGHTSTTIDMCLGSLALDIQSISRLACDVISALAHIHEKGFTHNDVTPQSVFIVNTETVS